MDAYTGCNESLSVTVTDELVGIKVGSLFFYLKRVFSCLTTYSSREKYGLLCMYG